MRGGESYGLSDQEIDFKSRGTLWRDDLCWCLEWVCFGATVGGRSLRCTAG